MNRPRLILAGLSGGAGKSTLTLGLCRAWVRQGRKVQPFKKGPDYIDAAWMGLAACSTPTNLDPFLMPEPTLRALFWDRVLGGDVGVIEGNRGLFDGKDLAGSCSTAELARSLEAPVILIIDCTKMTRTAAAVVAGCLHFESGFELAGVICNRTAGDRHRRMLTQCIEEYTKVPVLGCLPKISPDPIPERHMGLMSNRELGDQESVLESLADIAEHYLDLDALWEIAGKASAPSDEKFPSGPLWPAPAPAPDSTAPADSVVIAYVRDAAFWFYYEENLEALRRAGAELVEISLLETADWPEFSGLYIGGGFPETLALQLAKNTTVRQRIRSLAEMGLPIYAECGGFMYLGQHLVYQGERYPMAGVFPVSTECSDKPQGLGYVQAVVEHQSPFFSVGDVLMGHEFHYSHCVPEDGAVLTLALKMDRGQGLLAGYDGLVHKNTYAAYTHIHALGVPQWAPNFIAAARHYQGSASGGLRTFLKKGS